MTPAPSAQIIWLSDPHYAVDGLVQGHNPRKRLDAAIDHINTHYAGADLCIISGDMVETATVADYQGVRARLKQLAMPWHPMTGNHDRRALFLAHMPLPDTVMPGFAQYVIELPTVRLICLDTLWEGQDAGLLCADRLAWLQDQLKIADARPVIVFAHHPPVALGLPMLDMDRLSNGADMLDILARHPNVRQLCCGHVHRPVSGVIGSMGLACLRATLYQAPPPAPAWDWASFKPAAEAPQLGIITIEDDRIILRYEEFCSASYGVVPG